MYASPNEGFRAQLLLFEKMGNQLDLSNLQYKLYLFKAASAILAKGIVCISFLTKVH